MFRVSIQKLMVCWLVVFTASCADVAEGLEAYSRDPSCVVYRYLQNVEELEGYIDALEEGRWQSLQTTIAVHLREYSENIQFTGWLLLTELERVGRYNFLKDFFCCDPLKMLMFFPCHHGPHADREPCQVNILSDLFEAALPDGAPPRLLLDANAEDGLKILSFVVWVDLLRRHWGIESFDVDILR